MIDQEIKNYVDSQIKQSQTDARYGTTNKSYHTHNNIDSPKISFINIIDNPNYFCVATTTNGTTAVNVLSNPNFNLTITGVFLISNDTTAGNITLKNNGNTVATIAKGTSAGVLVGAVSLANTAYSRGNPLTVVSSSAGNSTVFITFTI